MFYKYFDVDSVTDSIIGQLTNQLENTKQNSQNDWETLGQQFAGGLITLMTPAIKEGVKAQLTSLVEGTSGGNDNQAKGLLGIGQGFNSLKKLEDLKIKRDGAIATIEMNVQGVQSPVTIKMKQTPQRYWKIIEFAPEIWQGIFSQQNSNAGSTTNSTITSVNSAPATKTKRNATPVLTPVQAPASTLTPTQAQAPSQVFSDIDKQNFLNLVQIDVDADKMIVQAATLGESGLNYTNTYDNDLLNQASQYFIQAISYYKTALGKYQSVESINIALMPELNNYIALMEESINDDIQALDYRINSVSDTAYAADAAEISSPNEATYLQKAVAATQQANDLDLKAKNASDQASPILKQLMNRADSLMPQ